jgi:HJR/Mrr/RecB family endonuclease
MSSVFISHSSGDRAFALRLAEDLRSHDYNVRSIADIVSDPSRLSRTELDDRLSEAIFADTFFLPVLTPSSVTSPWIHKELAVAIESEANLDSVKILPVLREPCVLPLELGLRSPIDFTRSYEDGLTSLLAVLAPPDPASAAINVALKTSIDERAMRTIVGELSRSKVVLLDLNATQIERVIANVLQDYGYEVRLTVRSKDAGIDVLVFSGWDAERVPLYLQCKRYLPNKQLTLEWVDSLVASSISNKSAQSMLVTESSCFPLDRRPAGQERWRARSRLYLDRYGWARLLLWLAESYAGDTEAEERAAAARERYAELTDKRFLSQLDESETRELEQVESFLDTAEAPYYEPIKQRLRAIRDQIRKEAEGRPKLN